MMSFCLLTAACHCIPSCCAVQASLSEMIPPGALVMLTPVVVGVLFGTRTLAGVLAGALVSGVQMAVSMSNTGGAWDNAKASGLFLPPRLINIYQASAGCVLRHAGSPIPAAAVI